jgi:hypothetical protein
MAGRVQSCELRDDSNVGAGRDVLMLEADEPLFSRRCVDERGARYMAHTFKQDTLRAAWVETRSREVAPFSFALKRRWLRMRRFTWLTNGFSKMIENHMAATALHFAYYNFCRVHQTLRVTPAMEARLTDHAWNLEELIALLDRRSEVAA